MKNSSLALSESEKFKLFWASFLALTAAGVGFVFRVMIPDIWAADFSITKEQVGNLTGAALWPIAITMILFSLLVDKIGYKISMFFAFAFQTLSVILTIRAANVSELWWACFCAGLGHGVVEAVINPLCASIYRDSKSKMLNILHASWPAGIVIGGVVYMLLVGGAASDGTQQNWVDIKWIFWIMLVPVAAYGLMFLLCFHFPVDERVEANVSMHEMLREFGGLGAFLASSFLLYELFSQLGLNDRIEALQWGDNGKLYLCLGLGAIFGFLFGAWVKSPGKILFFVLCTIMVPLAAAELATDAWIRSLMEPSLGAAAGWAIIVSAGIMMFLRFFAGIPLKFVSPPVLLLISSLFSIVGLYALSASVGMWIFAAFVLYAVGQTFYWPTMLGLVSEQFPRGGAMTLNTVSAMGLLTVGIFGFPFLGAVQDNYNTQTLKRDQPALYAQVKDEERTFTDDSDPGRPVERPYFKSENFFGYRYESMNRDEFLKIVPKDELAPLKEDLKSTSQSALKVAALLPAVMAGAFLLIIIYFAARGGYHPVVLTRRDE
jgi:MFS family permease